MSKIAKILASSVERRTYSRPKPSGDMEKWSDIVARVSSHVQELGEFSREDRAMNEKIFREKKSTPSGRMLWVGGTAWSKKLDNHPGCFNCFSTTIKTWEDFESNFDYLMQGTGAGSVSTIKNVSELPEIKNTIELQVMGEYGSIPEADRQDHTSSFYTDLDKSLIITVGDSRQGWALALRLLLEASSHPEPVEYVYVDISNVRPKGAKIKGFGGVTNPSGLATLFQRTVEITNKAVNRQLTPVEVELILCETAKAVIAGNVRRSARIALGSSSDQEFEEAKSNLWQPGEDGKWRIDPDRDALRMANFTRLFQRPPTLKECEEAVEKQYYSNEGAIEWAGESLARANADVLDTEDKKLEFLELYRTNPSSAGVFLFLELEEKTGKLAGEYEMKHRMERYGLNPCLTGNTPVLTTEGVVPIKELVGKKVTIWDGLNWTKVDNFRVTGENQPVYKIRLASGEEVEATESHSFFVFPVEREHEILSRDNEGLDDDEIIFEESKRKTVGELETGESLVQHLWSDDGLGSYYYGESESLLDEIVSIEFSHVEPQVYCCTVPTTGAFALGNRLMSGNCGEIIGSNFFCNLSLVHLDQVNPFDLEEQRKVFTVAANQAACLLKLDFDRQKYKESRELDPIVAVNFTGGFDFFLALLGETWLKWWQADRVDSFNLEEDEEEIDLLYYLFSPDSKDLEEPTTGEKLRMIEDGYLSMWKRICFDVVHKFCDENNLKKPNRVTAIQPAGTKSILTGATPGWHPPIFGYSFIRRVQFQREHPIALACLRAGLNVIPSADQKDENGNLLEDPFDPRVDNWLVEYPILHKDAETMEKVGFDPSKISAIAQFDFAMQVQKSFTTHNTSATINFSEHEIKPLAKRLYEAIQKNEGYVSFAMMQRFEGNGSMPRLPYQPISIELATELADRVVSPEKFEELIDEEYRKLEETESLQESKIFCTSQSCEMPNAK